MSEEPLKFAVLSALRPNSDFSKLQALAVRNERETRAFFRWLDQSGLALYLAWQLRESGAFESAPERLRSHLQEAMESNRARTEAMLIDFGKVSGSLRTRGVCHAFLKGFTLAPEFCPEPFLRHQSDIDVLISLEAAAEARAAIFDCGYSLERKLPGGETHFSTQLTRAPSIHDYIYRVDFQKEVELHISIWEDVEEISLQAPGGCLERTRECYIEGVPFTCLSREDAVVAQFLHAFRHFVSSWIRLSWLWEIHYFLSRHPADSSLWMSVRQRAGHDPVLRNAFGLILRLTNRLFASPIPGVLREWCIDPLPEIISSWVLDLGTGWALSEFPGNKLSLLIHKEFMRDAKRWKPYLWRRLVPLRGKPSLSKSGSPSGKVPFRFNVSHRIFQAKRLAFHAKSLVSFPYQAWLWNRAAIQAGAKPQPLIGTKPKQV
jgi:Uncharacterised nucleotidyltransferase